MSAVLGRILQGTPAGSSLPWRRLTWAAWRQHRPTLTIFAILIGLLAIFMAVTGLVLHRPGANVYGVGPTSQWPLFDASHTILQLAVPLTPAIAGMFLGASLIAREIETGAARFTWVQGAGRTRWLAATVVPVVVLLAVIAIGLALEYRWWGTFDGGNQTTGANWAGFQFAVNPLPFAGWMVLGFTLGVFFGAVIRRSAAAMAATLAGYILVTYAAVTWRPGYLPPLREAGLDPQFSAGGGIGWTFRVIRQSSPSADLLGHPQLGWPNGRLLSRSELNQSPAWFRLHDIQVWLAYQPGSRFLLFQRIEFGWLIVLSAILIAAAFVLIRRRAA